MARRQHLGWFFSRGFGPQGWGHPYREWNHDWTRPELYQQSARELEQAGFEVCGEARDGMEAELADLADGDRRPARRLLERLVDRLGPVAERLRCSAELECARELVEANGSILQRRIVRRAGTPRALVDWLCERFLDPVGQAPE